MSFENCKNIKVWIGCEGWSDISVTIKWLLYLNPWFLNRNGLIFAHSQSLFSPQKSDLSYCALSLWKVLPWHSNIIKIVYKMLSSWVVLLYKKFTTQLNSKNPTMDIFLKIKGKWGEKQCRNYTCLYNIRYTEPCNKYSTIL